jgi:hypothetical protein
VVPGGEVARELNVPSRRIPSDRTRSDRPRWSVDTANGVQAGRSRAIRLDNYVARRAPAGVASQATLLSRVLRIVSGREPIDHSPWLQPGDCWADDRRTSRLAWSYTVLSRPEAASTSVHVRMRGMRGGSHHPGGHSRTPAGGASSP